MLRDGRGRRQLICEDEPNLSQQPGLKRLMCVSVIPAKAGIQNRTLGFPPSRE